MDNNFFIVLFIFIIELFRNGECVLYDEGDDRVKNFRPRGIHDYLLGSRVTSGAPIDELNEIYGLVNGEKV